MARTARKITPATAANEASDTPMVSEATAMKLEGSNEHGKFRPRPTIFDKAQETLTSEAAEKTILASKARQRLAEAADLFGEGEGKAKEARSIAQEAAFSLYQGRAKNLFSPDEVSSILGDQFGFKAKKDGKPSKTPEGQGEVIRKRIVRLADAYQYAYQNEDKAFFNGLPVDDVKGILLSVDVGQLPVFTAYDYFADLKKEHSSRVDTAFNPKAVMKLAESLAADGAAMKLVGNPDLVLAYTTLRDVIQLVGEAAAALEAETDEE
jgi:hypothetical protein